MSHQVIWTRKILDAFIAEAALTSEESEIMETRVAGMTRTQQAFYFNTSVSRIDKIIARLKIKYDAAQKHSSILMPRKNSAFETYMDMH